MPRVVLIGLNLGIYASLVVLLRSLCRIEQLPNVDGVLGHVSLPPDVIIINWLAFGAHSVGEIRRIRQLWPGTHLLVISGGRPLADLPSAPRTLPIANARVCLLLKEIRDNVDVFAAEFPVYSSQVSASLDYLGEHYAVASVRRLGRAVGAAPNYLSALLRTEIGYSARTYINQLRIEAAKWLLLETGEKLETIATKIGLHDASHLSRFFLKHAGNRPGAYRRETPQVMASRRHSGQASE